MKVALDTNVLAYAEGLNDIDKRDRALDLLAHLPSESIVLPVQVLGELFNVLVLKAKRPSEAARTAALAWRDACDVIDTSARVMIDALDLACEHRFRTWDAVILSTAADAGCRLLLSEDLQDGFTWRGVTVVNPFAAIEHPLLGALLEH